ncbi:MAG: trigger factor [Pleomorphochaeta sp.]
MIADKQIKETENSSVELSITLTAQSIEDAYSALLKKYAKDITIKGFRKGKAPLNLIERKYGEMIREESTFNELEENLKVALDEVEDKYKPLAYSTPTLMDEENLTPFKANTDLTYTVAYDVIPQFELPQYKGLEIEVSGVKIGKADVDKEIEKLRQQNAFVVSKEDAAAEGDIVTVDFAELDENGNETGAFNKKDSVITIGKTQNFFELDDEFVGMKAGDTKTIEKEFAQDFASEEYAGKKVSIKIDMKEVKFNDVPELDDEFAQDVNEDYKTVADLTKATRKNLKERAAQQLKELKYQAVADLLIEKCPIVPPKSMISAQADQQINNIARSNNMDMETFAKIFEMQGQTLDQLKETWTPSIIKDINVGLIKEKIKDVEEFEITDEEVTEALGDTSSYKPEQIDYLKEMITDELKLQKVNDFLIENNTFNEGKKLSYDELMSGPVAE